MCLRVVHGCVIINTFASQNQPDRKLYQLFNYRQVFFSQAEIGSEKENYYSNRISETPVWKEKRVLSTICLRVVHGCVIIKTFEKNFLFGVLVGSQSKHNRGKCAAFDHHWKKKFQKKRVLKAFQNSISVENFSAFLLR